MIYIKNMRSSFEKKTKLCIITRNFLSSIHIIKNFKMLVIVIISIIKYEFLV